MLTGNVFPSAQTTYMILVSSAYVRSIQTPVHSQAYHSCNRTSALSSFLLQESLMYLKNPHSNLGNFKDLRQFKLLQYFDRKQKYFPQAFILLCKTLCPDFKFLLKSSRSTSFKNSGLNILSSPLRRTQISVA